MPRPTRRQFLKGAAIATLAGPPVALVIGQSSPKRRPVADAAQGEGRETRPNILLIVTDEERQWERVEALVPSERRAAYRAAVPARSRLRSRGVRLANYYTTTAPCSPARGALYTGHHAPDTQVVDNLDFDAQAELSPEVPTMADVLGAAGYYCAYKGKVHLSGETMTAGIMRQKYGFRDWQGPTKLGDSEGPRAGYKHDGDTARNAAKWLREEAPDLTQPWLLAVNFINPHDIMLVDIDGRGSVQQQQSPEWPIVPTSSGAAFKYWWAPQPPPNFPTADGSNESGPRPAEVDEFASLLSTAFGNIPLDDSYTTTIEVYTGETVAGQRTKRITVPLWQAYLNYYLNCIVDNDRHVKTVVDALVDASHADSTVVIFTADHGELGLSHGGASRYFDEAMTDETEPDTSTTTMMPLRQKGAFAYEENNHLTFVAARLGDATGSRAAKALPAIDVDTPALGCSIDLVPTLLSWAGRSGQWYEDRYGARLADHCMRHALPGTSLAAVLARPRAFATPQWSTEGAGRAAVLLTSDAVSTLDADYAYSYLKGETDGLSVDATKKGMLRAFFDGTTKYVRYFAPTDYELVNTDPSTATDYQAITAAGQGQDLQVFDLGTDPWELANLAETADCGALESRLRDVMAAELADPGRTPNTVTAMLGLEAAAACT